MGLRKRTRLNNLCKRNFFSKSYFECFFIFSSYLHKICRDSQTSLVETNVKDPKSFSYFVFGLHGNKLLTKNPPTIFSIPKTIKLQTWSRLKFSYIFQIFITKKKREKSMFLFSSWKNWKLTNNFIQYSIGGLSDVECHFSIFSGDFLKLNRGGNIFEAWEI